ncbi:MAG: GntR family transcriptional regulator [Lachnospiraceae bacterium]|nr:GntR family transcriptional regulator [Lachnospiraceae bacterium]MBP5250227.1 GntR family transcriptional regulator [Lachnospiraceae bacterium]
MLDHGRGASPLYAQIEEILKNRIENGTYKKGELVPGEKALMDEFGVSRATARQALGGLSQAGYVSSHRGIGTTVVYEQINEHIKSVVSLYEEMKLHGIEAETTFCTVEKTVPPAKVRQELLMKDSEKCYLIKRVRSTGDEPFVYSLTYLNTKEKLSMKPSDYKFSLYRYLETEKGIRIVRGTESFEAVMPDGEVKERLETGDAPVMRRTRKTYVDLGEKEKAFEYSICFYPGKRFKYTVEI